MKRIIRRGLLMLVAVFVVVIVGCAPQGTEKGSDAAQSVTQVNASAPQTVEGDVVFVNTSRDPKGNTYAMGEAFLEGVPHKTIFLNDYKIYQLGQHFEGDQFNDVVQMLSKADVIVIGTPVYWHTMSGGLKTFIDRLYELDRPVAALQGKKLYFLMQGMSPSEETKKQLPYTMSRVANRYDMEYMGAATSMADMKELQDTLRNRLR